MANAAQLGGWRRFVTMQDQYSVVQREEEREMLPLLADQQVMSLQWCPLAKGRLARPFGTATVDLDLPSRRTKPGLEGGRTVPRAQRGAVSSLSTVSSRPGHSASMSAWRSAM